MSPPVRAHLISLYLTLGLTVFLVWGQAQPYLTLRGYPVSGSLPIISVGRGTTDSPALICYTTDVVNAVWLFPDGSEIIQRQDNVAATETDTFIYSIISVSIYKILTLRRGPGVRSPIGDYCCGSATNADERVCIRLVFDCGAPPSISNGFPKTPTKTLLGGTVTYTCNNGYQISPGVTMATASCMATGNWETVPTCLALCPSLSHPAHGVVEYKSDSSSLVAIENTVATYSCGNGYLLIGKDTRTCQPDRTWSSTAPYCADYALVQLRFAPTDHCIHWNDKKASQMSLYMRNGIQEVVLTEGNLTIPLDHIEEGLFSCHTHQDRTLFRTTVIGTLTASATEAVTYVQKWVESGSAVRVAWYIVFLDNACPVSISSLTEPECGQDVNFQRCVDICVARG